MRSTPGPIALVFGLVVNAAMWVWAQAPAGAPAPPSYSLIDPGARPFRLFTLDVTRDPAVAEELKLTDAQKQKNEDLSNQRFEKIRKVRQNTNDREKILAARDAVFKETEAALRESLEPGQRVRLAQIRLQLMGPLAFDRSAERYPDEFANDPDLMERLKLTDDQAGRAAQVATDGMAEIEKAATFPIVLDPKAGAPTPESIRALVESPGFKADKRRARDAARKAWASVIARIELVLTDSQRNTYHELLGAPFDLTTIDFGVDESVRDANFVARALNVGGGGGQRADPNFDTTVARPAYVATHPRVLFDEAHNNFHTTTGRYKPFADVISHDGYQVTPNKDTLTRDVLSRADILISANAVDAGPGRGSAFTEAECDAVRDWVEAGGSLLLITDHAPFGVGSESLARRFGVDMSKAFTSDPANSEGGATSLVFTRKNHLLGDHPITRGRDESERVNRVQTFTGQSLKGPQNAVAILKLADTAFDSGPDGKPVSAAGRAQGIALTFGKGRVVVLGEAAELSAQLVGNERFGMNIPGLDNRQMALNIMRWLSGLLEPR